MIAKAPGSVRDAASTCKVESYWGSHLTLTLGFRTHDIYYMCTPHVNTNATHTHIYHIRMHMQKLFSHKF